jgi:hypothetical protein
MAKRTTGWIDRRDLTDEQRAAVARRVYQGEPIKQDYDTYAFYAVDTDKFKAGDCSGWGPVGYL